MESGAAADQGQGSYPPGWYDFHGGRRFWDGERWTEHLAAPPAERSSRAGVVLIAVAAALGVGGCSFVLAPLIWFWVPIALGAVGFVLAALSTTPWVRGSDQAPNAAPIVALLVCAAAIAVGVLMRKDLEDKVNQDTLVKVIGAPQGVLPRV